MWATFVRGGVLCRWCDDGKGFVDDTKKLETGNIAGSLILNAFGAAEGSNNVAFLQRQA